MGGVLEDELYAFLVDYYITNKIEEDGDIVYKIIDNITQEIFNSLFVE